MRHAYAMAVVAFHRRDHDWFSGFRSAREEELHLCSGWRREVYCFLQCARWAASQMPGVLRERERDSLPLKLAQIPGTSPDVTMISAGSNSPTSGSRTGENRRLRNDCSRGALLRGQRRPGSAHYLKVGSNNLGAAGASI